MSNYKFYLNFLSDAIGMQEIDEPISFADISWDLDQNQTGYARDISYNSGEAELTFVDKRNHQLTNLLYYFNYFGFESKVNLIVEINSVQTILGELDFAQSSTDELTYLKCKVVQDSKLQIIKRRNDIKVDLFSDKDIDGNPITPLVPENILMKAKAVFQTSKWQQLNNFASTLSTPTSRNYAINPCVNLLQYEVEDSYTFFSTSSEDFDDYKVLTAKENLKNIRIELNEVYASVNPSALGAGTGTILFEFGAVYGDTWNTGTSLPLISQSLIQTSPTFVSNLQNYVLEIPSLQRGQSVWIAFTVNLVETSGNALNNQILATVDLKLNETIITAESTAYNTIAPSFRLIDVMRQVVKSISGLNISAPRFDIGGEFYDNRLLNGNLLRNIINKPFTISLKDISDSLIEMNGDFEVNEEVFFGVREDFYKPEEVWFFDEVQFAQTNRGFNEKVEINSFKYGYKKFQSQKENEALNSADTIHGESTWSLPSKLVENKKEVLIEWIRDSFLIEELRRKAYVITKETSSQNDDDIFAVDSIELIEDSDFTETTVLNHEYNTTNNILSLYNSGSINFVLLGIVAGSKFVIYAPDYNAGIYEVFAVSESEIKLIKQDVPPTNANGNGIRSTKYVYYISTTLTPYANYTNEGFTDITNLQNNDSYSNLRYSVKRNINNYWIDYLTTCNLFNNGKEITNTTYKNNGLCSTTYQWNTVLENKSINTGKTPILSPFIYNEMVFKNVEFEDYITIQNLIRTKRGFIRTINNNGNPIKVFPVKMSYENLNKQLTITEAEQKHEPTTLSIQETNGIILINDETGVLHLDYDIKENMVYIYDENHQLLYSPIWWYNVSVNGAIPQNINVLVEWLNLLL